MTLTDRQLKLKGPSSEKAFHSAKSSNMPFLQAVWDAAKLCTGVVSLRRHNQSIDIAAQGGLQWIKLSLVSEKRLLHEMAKQGWEWDGFSDSEDSGKEDTDSKIEPANPDDELPDLWVARVAKALADDAKRSCVKYRHPSISFMLPNITTGSVAEIDKVLDIIRSMGITVLCAGDIPPTPRLEDVLPNPMVHDDFAFFTTTLNVDCTILLALVSDISHASVAEEDWFNKDIKRQLAAEAKEKLLPNLLWPAMSNKSLECTDLAAQRMREISMFIGTDNEKQRMQILLAEGSWTGKTQEELVAAFENVSCHKVPKDWQLPIRVMNSVDGSTLPAVATTVGQQLTDINRSVCLYGWASRHTTITSNRTIAKKIRRLVEEHRASDDELGPDIWICWTSRSLVAKEKERRGK